jgi:hypothetical protein
MIQDPNLLIADFRRDVTTVGLKPLGSKIEYERQPAPHQPHALPVGKCAVYVFSLSEGYGRQCRAGAHRVLKVGMAGLNSNARFQSQHYNPRSAPSTVAGVLLQSRVLWPYLGITNIREDEAGAWLRKNTDRDNFYLEAVDAELLRDLERYVRARLGPALEGG